MVRLKGAEVVHHLHRQLELGGVVDEYLADQIVIFMALATAGVGGCFIKDGTRSRTPRRCEILVGEISSHTLTAMKVAEDMLGNVCFSTKACENGGNMMICEQITQESHISVNGET